MLYKNPRISNEDFYFDFHKILTCCFAYISVQIPKKNQQKYHQHPNSKAGPIQC